MAAAALCIRMQIPGCSTASFSNTPPVCSGDGLGCMACLPKGGLPPPPACPGAHRLLQSYRDEASLRPCSEGTANVWHWRSSLGRDRRAATEKHWSLIQDKGSEHKSCEAATGQTCCTAGLHLALAHPVQNSGCYSQQMAGIML